LNLLNPLVLITWLGITIFLESNLKYGKLDLFLFYTSVFISTFASQTAVCYFSHKIKNYLSELFIHRMNIIIGIIFITAGILLYMSGTNTQAEVEKAQEFLK
jgi:threonine/homoserine/homoserine lactone efflux protein